MKNSKFSIIIFGFLLIGAIISCNQKSETKNDSRIKEEYSNISFGFRGESLIYKLNGKEYEIWSTWIEGRQVYLDDLDKTNLTEKEKTEIFEGIIKFILRTENQKPIFFYNKDLKSSSLWKKLCENHSSEIERIEVTNTEQENIDFYNTLVEDLKYEGTEININGFTIKSVEELDEHWDEIKK
ncbi:MAG: hypothetical protein JKY02_01860 [Flavobacteriaceae bacterium]|nr:hypothetical protein [Flavobacteriaceae bacterium]